jgi:rhomboid family GlyGly-CTERM serine protease
MKMTKSIRPLIIAIIGLSLLLFVSQSLQNEFVFNRNNIAQGQWWRLLTGNLTHSNFSHLALNITGLWILGFLFIDSLKIKTFTITTIILSLIVGCSLYFYSPELDFYYGFSGVLYGLYIIGAISAIIKQDYFTGLLVLLLIIAKISWDLLNGGSASSAELIGIPVAIDAHLYGVIGAFVISFVFSLPSLMQLLKKGGGAI